MGIVNRVQFPDLGLTITTHVEQSVQTPNNPGGLAFSVEIAVGADTEGPGPHQTPLKLSMAQAVALQRTLGFALVHSG